MGAAHAQSLVTVKTWNFTIPHGSLQITLKSSPDGSGSLGFGPSGQVLEAPISEQIEPLKHVLADMKAFGMDPGRLTYIGTRISSQDVLQTLAYACVDSKEWRLSMKNGAKGKEKLVIDLLNHSRSFEQYNDAFKPYGIRAGDTAAEKVGLMPFSRIPARNSEDHANASLLVPADAMLGMSFLKSIPDAKESDVLR
jgi:hypothetical protein